MRPLAHPAISDVPLESILHALSDPVRVAIFADIEKPTCGKYQYAPAFDRVRVVVRRTHAAWTRR